MKDDKIDNNNTKSAENNTNNFNETNNTSNSANLSSKDNTQKIKIEVKIKPEEITLKGKTIEEILSDIEKNPGMEFYDSYRIKTSENIISLEDDDNNFEVHYLFKTGLIINYKNVLVSNKIVNLVDKSVKSSIQIEKTMEIYKIKSLIYETIKHRYFPTFKNILYELVENNNFTIDFLCVMDEFKYIFDQKCIKNIPDKIVLNSLSKYSDKYFPYSDNEIDYINTKERKNFLDKLIDFIFINDVNFFKITGPSNDGKTLTLLLFSRTRNNIIYFNLKYIMGLFYSNDTSYLNVMIYELGRAHFSANNQINEIENIFKEDSFRHPWKILLKLTEALINESKIIILDQLKEKTIDFTIFKKIEEKVKGKALKFIICSSINDTFIKYKVLNTIKDFHGNPEYLNKDCQDYYFYFCNLLNKVQLKLYYEKKNESKKCIDSFGYNPKFIYMFNKSDDELNTFKNIKSHIIKKLKESYKEKDVSYNEILFLISFNLGKELDYVNDFNILPFISLKYFNLEFHKEYFKINCCFKYIKELIDEITLDKDIEEYFKKDKYNNSNFYKLLKPYYFEESCINSMKRSKILPSKEFHHQIFVQTIAELDECSNNILSKVNQKSEKELSLKDYYSINVKTIEKIIKDKNLVKKKEEEDINYHLYQALETKKENFNTLLKKKRYKHNNEEGIEEDIDIDKKKIKIYEYNESFNNGSIIINQINKIGKTLDFAFLYGEKDSKIFIGFQMKCYEKDIKISDDKKKKLNKEKIKDSLRLLLAQSLIKYNINIIEWHYFIISFYNPDNGNYNQDIVNICKEEGLEYLFHDPKSQCFYNKDFSKIEGEIQLTFNSNLDYNKSNIPELIFENFHIINSNYYEYCSISSLKKKLNEKATEFINIVNENYSLIQINRKIKDKLNGEKYLSLISIYNYSKEFPFPIPNESYLLLFVNKNCDDFVYYYKKNHIFHGGFVFAEQNDKIDPFFLSAYVNTEKSNFLVYKLQ